MSTGSTNEQSALNGNHYAKQRIKIGYKEELMKGLNTFMAFTLSLTNSGFATSIMIQFGYGLTTGGPAVMIWSWIIIGAFNICNCLSIAEICSSYPAEGGPYYWVGVMAPRGYGPIISYLVGITYFIGQLANTASLVTSVTIILSALTELATGYEWTNLTQIIIALSLLVLIFLKSIMKINIQGYFQNIAGISQLVGIAWIVLVVFYSSMDNLSTTEFVFFTFNNETGFTNTKYVCYIGALFTFYSVLGFEAAGTCAEETIDETRTAPNAMIYNTVISYICGFVTLVVLLYSAGNNLDDLIDGSSSGIVNLFQVVFTGNKIGLISSIAILFTMVTLVSFTSITVASRVLFAMARDQAIPYWHFFYYINPSRKSPDRIVVLIFILECVLCSLILVCEQAFTIMSQTCVFCFLIVYLSVILLRLTSGRESFQQSDFNLGPFSLVIGWAAAIFLIFTSGALLLPTTKGAFNLTPLIMIVIYGIAFIMWYLPNPMGVRHHYYGPKKPQLVSIVDYNTI